MNNPREVNKLSLGIPTRDGETFLSPAGTMKTRKLTTTQEPERK